MSKVTLTAAALTALLLAACGSQEQNVAANGAVDSGSNATEASGPSDPAQPGSPGNASVDPAPPPDAVSHPDGYLPPAPAEADPASVNASGPESPAATEDEYIRNRQAGR